jgi:hypothetical protein
MLNTVLINRAVDMQDRSYRLLIWMADAVTKGFIDFKTAHRYSSRPEATVDWILSHYMNIPENARVSRDDLEDFSAFFSTYLENTFDLVTDPGKQLYSPDAHCFCPMCSWLIDAPNLKTKKVSTLDKHKARKMKIAAIQQLAVHLETVLSDHAIEKIVNDPSLRGPLSLVTYAYDLLRRMKGISVGPAVLVLWRGFAWTKEGSPKKGFKLTTEMIIGSEKRLSKIIQKIAVKHN